MRAISLVNRIEFEFTGNVVRNALCLGDIDNDGCIELIIGNETGDIAIFKGKDKVQVISKHTLICCVAVGDILNQNKNSLVVITADGWCYIYEVPTKDLSESNNEDFDEVDGQMHSSSNTDAPASSSESTNTQKSTKNVESPDKMQVVCIHVQRIPANVKNILLGDIDGDGAVEMVLGLTDRVVRSYKWMGNTHKPANLTEANLPIEPTDKLLGKFVAMNKWECANQIGSITLHHTWDGLPSLLIAQPGGTFMRIKCFTDDISAQPSVNSDLSNSNSSQGESGIPGSVDYQFLGLTRMRNQNISTEILGDFKNSHRKDSGKGKPYAVATLDGTIMLVQDEVILWAFAVDHQIFALTKLDITGNGSDDIVACCWDGQTYILDQDKNVISFPLDEPVQAFESGYYHLKGNDEPVTCFVYVTFKNTIILYYDIPIKDIMCKKFEPNVEKLSELFIEEKGSKENAEEHIKSLDKKTRKELVEYLLYNVKS
ncbi:unnamed protein product [Brassicogethes aeneus]|uniref:KICSTOR complex protein ITFG2-like n=1 Tax=Brassicogethes aeneus TaxID=1431903 RepID=A0A9P0FAC4_BRAAE|nr:unnamed protein product [Brassicogethes aeneus]